MSVVENLIVQSAVLSETITFYAVTPLLIFFVGLGLAALLKNGVRAALRAVQLDMRVRNSIPFSPTNTAGNITFVLVAIVFTCLALASVDILGFVLSRILFFLSWFGLLALALAATDGIRNLSKRKTAQQAYPIGETYSAHGLSGVVKKHTWTHLVVFSTQAERVHVPYLRAARAVR